MRDHDALIAFLRARRDRPFAWGRRRNDCVAFGFGAVKVQTRRDLAAELGVDWSSKAQAVAVLKALGGLEAALDRVLPRTPCAMAHRGDLALAPTHGGSCLMVVEGETLIGVAQDGVLRLPRRVMTMAWSIEGRP